MTPKQTIFNNMLTVRQTRYHPNYPCILYTVSNFLALASSSVTTSSLRGVTSSCRWKTSEVLRPRIELRPWRGWSMRSKRWISQPSRNCQTWSIVYHLSSRIFKAPFGPLVSSHTWCVWACVFLIDAWWSLKLHSFGRRRIRKLYGRIRKLYGRIRKLWFGNYDSETIRSDSETMIRKLYGRIRKLWFGNYTVGFGNYTVWFGNYDSETMIRKLWFGNYTVGFGNYTVRFGNYDSETIRTDSETMIRKLYGWIRKLYGLIRKLWFGNYTVWFGNYVSETIRSDSETIRSNVLLE